MNRGLRGVRRPLYGRRDARRYGAMVHGKSHLFEIDLLTDHEPGNPGGETPPSTAGGTPAATEGRFMGSSLFEIDLLTDLEPGNPGGETPPSTAGGTPAATEAGFMGRCSISPGRDHHQKLGSPSVRTFMRLNFTQAEWPSR